MQPHRRQPTRLPHPWDSPGKNTGVGCHFPLQCMKVKSESEVTQSCPTLCYPMDCSLPGSSVPSLSFQGHRNLLFTCLHHGQMAKKHLKKEDKNATLRILKSIISEHPMPLKEMGDQTITHKAWLWLAQHSFSLACTLRNLLNVGF